MTENWGLPIKDWGSPTEDWGLPTEDWGLPTEDWGLPTEDCGLPIEDWGLPIENWGFPTESLQNIEVDQRCSEVNGDCDLRKADGHKSNDDINKNFEDHDLRKKNQDTSNENNFLIQAPVRNSFDQNRDHSYSCRSSANRNKSYTPEKPVVIAKKTYIPLTFDDNNDLAIEAGLNFPTYNKFEVKVSGIEVPKQITLFEESPLCDVLLSNLTKCNYIIPTPIQKYALPIIMEGRDMIASAQTGSGKTTAFILPILYSLMIKPSKLYFDLNHCEPQALILVPTRELSIQICEVITKLSKGTNIKCGILYGGTATYYQKQKILGGVHIIVATVGRLIDFVNQGIITFQSLRFFVLDEVDFMLALNFQKEIEYIFNHNTMVSSVERSIIIFSATLPEGVRQIVKAYLKPNYIYVDVGETGGACKDIAQTVIEVQRFAKKQKLLALLQETKNCQGIIIFVQKKRLADFIAAFLCEMNFPTTSIHGDRDQPEREKALRDFKTKKIKILVVTAIAARGLDIIGVTMVVNMDLPKSINEYMHRIGRTGRLGNSGKVVSFFDPQFDQKIAPSLINTLKLADQHIPEFLLKYSNRGECGSTSSFGDVCGKNATVTSEMFEKEEKC
ncbi:Helicase, C-terminal,Helicase superfamily 1/2, ATP-binding domain,P-loop containing nucleoside [Cinara cedri]|uniref:RNA helicase n=1 Tax=Cinara cedri TaxID=506608 RepID=A0A5E4MTF5_9HEMI|nr:Helicase, C-terminal,Helicase superfamily 1/2, ATP-binding domain,P-loop containing nucleoside [Cinara cedri]